MNTAKSCIMQTGVETNVKFLSHKGVRPGNLSSVSLLLLSKSICYPFLSCLFVLLPLLLLRLQTCLTLCDPIDGSPPGSTVPRILQARTLEWVAISFSNAWKWKVKVKSLSRVRLLVTPWTAAYQAPPSMGFSRQEYWSGVFVLAFSISSSCE